MTHPTAQDYADELLAAGVPPRDVPAAMRWARERARTTPLTMSQCISDVRFMVRTTWRDAMEREAWWSSIRGTRGTLAEFEAHLARRCVEVQP